MVMHSSWMMQFREGKDATIHYAAYRGGFHGKLPGYWERRYRPGSIGAQRLQTGHAGFCARDQRLREKNKNWLYHHPPEWASQLIPKNGKASREPATAYLNAIDGVGREARIAFLDIAKANNVKVLVTDYCSTQTKMADSYAKNANRGYISFAADRRELDQIPAYPEVP